MRIVFRNEGQAIKTWVNVEYDRRGIPAIGDVVVLHWGDDGDDDGERYVVCQREYDGRDLETLVLHVTPEPDASEGVH